MSHTYQNILKEYTNKNKTAALPVTVLLYRNGMRKKCFVMAHCEVQYRKLLCANDKKGLGDKIG